MGKTMASLGFVLAMLGIGAGLQSCTKYQVQSERQVASASETNAKIQFDSQKNQ